MNAPAETTLQRSMAAMGKNAQAAAGVLRLLPATVRARALLFAAEVVRRDADAILTANERDCAAAKDSGASRASLDRLMLDSARIGDMVAGIETIASLPDPVGRELARWTRPNGLDIARVSTPIGVIGVIYESRPNVTAGVAAIGLKSANAAILRPGSESFASCRAIHRAFVRGIALAGVPETAVQLVPSADREAVGMMLSGLNGAIDLIVPRGGKSLVARVQAEARVPVLAHSEGVCHVYVHARADLDKARRIVLNAKMRRTGICGAAETLLVDRAVLTTHLLPILGDLVSAGCEIRGDAGVRAIYPATAPATEDDWRQEYLDAIIAVRAVEGLEDAVRHIETYGSHHTDSIVTEDRAAAERFVEAVDSAIVMHNASTQFADGGEFGFGGEVGIATGKLHARGPVGPEQLTTFKYVVRGNGQTRP